MDRNIDFSTLPKHIGIIMDGNGRWAKKRFLAKKAGHKAGAEAFRKLTLKMNENGFKYLTVYAFSTENWNRPAEEVKDLMNLIREYIQKHIEESKKNNVRMNVIGDIRRLDLDLQNKIENLIDINKNHTGLCVNIAINYGGQDEILRAAKKMCDDVIKNNLNLDTININAFSAYLDTAGQPSPDLIIRTAGEMRLSNFLLWQAAYSEFVVCDKFWPDFTYDDLLSAVVDFQSRERRFGRR